jgi:hypothetical protein
VKARRRNPAGLCRFQPNAAANAVSVSIHIYAAIVGHPPATSIQGLAA